MLYEIVQVIGIIVAGVFVSPLMLLFAILLLVFCVFVAMHFLAGAREVKRLESNCKSPIFEQFGSVLVGLGKHHAIYMSTIPMILMKCQVPYVLLTRLTITLKGW